MYNGLSPVDAVDMPIYVKIKINISLLRNAFFLQQYFYKNLFPTFLLPIFQFITKSAIDRIPIVSHNRLSQSSLPNTFAYLGGMLVSLCNKLPYTCELIRMQQF